MKTILIIEDEPSVLENIVEIISDFGYNVIFSNNGTEGLELAKSHQPDLILCDVMMPGVDGYEVLEGLQQSPELSAIPFIFLTAKVDRDDMRQGMNLGADDYLTKPFTPDQLRNAIEVRFKKKEKTYQEINLKLDDFKTTLATTLPHEFRTPLNGILASSQFLIEYFDSLELDEVKKLHQNIYTSAGRLHRLIVNYLLYADLALLKGSQLMINQKYTTNQPSEIIVKMFEKTAEHYSRVKDLKIHIKNTCDIYMKQEHFQKICEEVADNAFKFSETESKITVTVDVVDGEFQLIVNDNGRGMTSEQIENIAAYVQFDRHIYEQQGSGLGIIIIKKLCEIYNGRFEIFSELNQFTKIIITLKCNKSISN